MAKEMKFAVVDSDEEFHKIIKKSDIFKNNADHFQSCSDFGKVKLSSYDIIVLGSPMPMLSGEEIAKSIREKTDAIIVLMSSDSEVISKEARNGNTFYVMGKDAFSNIDDVKEFFEWVKIRKETQGYFKEVKTCFSQISSQFSGNGRVKAL